MSSVSRRGPVALLIVQGFFLHRPRAYFFDSCPTRHFLRIIVENQCLGSVDGDYPLARRRSKRKGGQRRVMVDAARKRTVARDAIAAVDGDGLHVRGERGGDGNVSAV